MSSRTFNYVGLNLTDFSVRSDNSPKEDAQREPKYAIKITDQSGTQWSLYAKSDKLSNCAFLGENYGPNLNNVTLFIRGRSEVQGFIEGLRFLADELERLDAPRSST